MQVRPAFPEDVFRRIAEEYLLWGDFLNLRSTSRESRTILDEQFRARLPIARTLAGVQARRDLAGLSQTVAPFFRQEVELRLARIDHAEVAARRACCANRILIYVSSVGLFGGAMLLAAGKHQAIPWEVKVGTVIMALAVAACLVSVLCERLAERHGRVLDRGGVPRPRSPDVSYGADFYGFI